MYNLDLLKELYLTFSPSRHESEMSVLIQRTLATMKIPFKVDKHGQVYNLSHKNRPLISAHMDQVQHRPCTAVYAQAGGSVWVSETGLGADDKNGIWIIFHMLTQNPDLNFIFSVEEECMGFKLDELLLENKKFLTTKVLYGLVFDRKGWGDIIGTQNSYCTEEMEKAVAGVGGKFGYSPASGVYSDADRLNLYMSCVNLSCGYFGAHTEDEYTLLPALFNAAEFGLALVDKLTVRFEKPVPKPARTFGYNFYTRGAGNRSRTSVFEELGLTKPKTTPLLDNDDAWTDHETDDMYVCPSCYQEVNLDNAMLDALGNIMCDICTETIPVGELLGSGYLPITDSEAENIKGILQAAS